MQGRWKRPRAWLAVALVTAIAGCGSLGRNPEPAFATLVVENGSQLTVNVFTVVQGIEYRLGTVSGFRTGRFSLRRHMLDADRMLLAKVQPLAEYRPYFSERIPVSEGDVIELEVSSFIR